MSLVRFSDHIYYLPGESETDRPYLYYIKGNNCSAVIDAGNSKMHVDWFYDELKKNSLPLPTYTILTHWHWDHTFGLAYIHGTSIATELTNQKLKAASSWKWTLEDMSRREETGEDIPFCNECIRKVYPDLSVIHVTTADQTIAAEKTLDLGGIHLNLIPRDSTHTRDALFIHVPEERTLIIGDADGEDHYERNGTYDPDRLRSLIDFVENMDIDHYLLGHDKPDTKAGALEYMRGELAKIEGEN